MALGDQQGGTHHAGALLHVVDASAQPRLVGVAQAVVCHRDPQIQGLRVKGHRNLDVLGLRMFQGVVDRFLNDAQQLQDGPLLQLGGFVDVQVP